MLGLVGLITAT